MRLNKGPGESGKGYGSQDLRTLNLCVLVPEWEQTLMNSSNRGVISHVLSWVIIENIFEANNSFPLNF